MREEVVDGERFYFDEAAAARACAAFPRYFRHTEGEFYGRPFELLPWQANDVIRPAFGWKRADGRRRYTVVYVSLAKKNGKTEFAAAIALLLLVGDGEFGGQGYSVATDKDQAKLVFNKATVMVGLSPELGSELQTFKTSIFCPNLLASFKPLSSTARSKHGFAPSFCVGDETHAWEHGEIHDVLHKGTAARRQPLEVYITHAGIHGDGYGWDLHDRMMQIRDGTIVDPHTLVVHYGLDPDDDWKDEAHWAKANPSLGVTPKLSFLREEAAKAQASVRAENNFRRFHLNQWVEQHARWISLDQWDACQRAVDVAALRGRRCFGGLDLARRHDFSAFTLVFPPEREDGDWIILPYFWLPEADMAKRAQRDNAPYESWVRDKLITTTEGETCDFRYVRDDILRICEMFVVEEIAFDRFFAEMLIQYLMDEGLTMVEFGMGYASMAAPSAAFERLIIAGKLHHDGNRVMRWMVGNLSFEVDSAGNFKPSKLKSIKRIDGPVSCITALGRAIRHGDGDGWSLPEDYEIAAA